MAADRIDASQVAHSDFHFKVALLGDPQVGKSALLHRATEDSFLGTYIQTSGTEHQAVVLVLDRQGIEHSIDLQLWDGPSSEPYRTETKVYELYHSSHGALIMFDVTSRESFDRVAHFVSEAHVYTETTSDNLTMLLVGCKVDSEVMRNVTHREAQAMAEQLRCDGYVECSARTSEGIDDLLTSLATSVLSRIERGLTPEDGYCLGPPRSLEEKKAATVIQRVVRGGSTRKHLLQNFIQQDEGAFSGVALDQIIAMLAYGVQCTKFSPNGHVARNVMWLDGDRMRMYIGAHKRDNPGYLDKGLFVADIAEVRRGVHAYSFRVSSTPPEDEDLCMSIIGTERTIDVVLDTATTRDVVVMAIKKLADSLINRDIRKARAKDRWAQARFMLLRKGRPSMQEVAITANLRAVLTRGMQVRKHTSNGKVHRRILFLGLNGTRLFVDTRVRQDASHRHKGLDLNDVSEIRPGADAFNFTFASASSQEELRSTCLSIIGSERTIAIELEDEQSRDYLLSRLQVFMKIYRPESLAV